VAEERKLTEYGLPVVSYETVRDIGYIYFIDNYSDEKIKKRVENISRELSKKNPHYLAFAERNISRIEQIDEHNSVLLKAITVTGFYEMLKSADEQSIPFVTEGTAEIFWRDFMKYTHEDKLMFFHQNLHGRFFDENPDLCMWNMHMLKEKIKEDALIVLGDIFLCTNYELFRRQAESNTLERILK
jgi:hypothetical protein